MAKPNEPTSWTDANLRLAVYWLRAELMHNHLHEVREFFGDDFDAIEEHGFSTVMETYLVFWLSALFVVVEGFNKLKIKDPKVSRLFVSHVQELKRMRHATYHFTFDQTTIGTEVIGQLNWA